MTKRNTKIRTRPAEPHEILKWLVDNGMVVCLEKDGRTEWRITLMGILFAASKPPGAVTDYIPGAKS